jgi:3-oxoacyl-[acyl-carrier protein] reductase
MLNEIKGKVALVTGSSRGIGRAIAIALAQEGVHVAVNYNSNKSLGMELSEELKEKYKVKSVCVGGDVSLISDVTKMVETIRKELGQIDILVNTAGVGRYKTIDEITEQDWEETINLNLKSAFLVTQAVLPDMRSRKWGRIINLSSSAALNGGTMGAHYAASKAGLIGLTHYYASNLAKEGITVNSIAPGPINTDLAKGTKTRPDMIPVGRFGEPEEVAILAVMLAKNAFITGQNISINGGIYFQ